MEENNDLEEFNHVGHEKDFDWEEEQRVAAWTAKWFVNSMGADLDTVLKKFNLSRENYEKYNAETDTEGD